MSNAITNFGQFHLALTGLANHSAIGVVPTIRNGAPAFGSIGEPLARVPSPVRVDFTREHPEGLDMVRLARAHDDTVFLDEFGYLKGTLQAEMGMLLPDDEFFGRSITEAQTERRDRIKGQVTQGFAAPDEPAGRYGDASKFGDMTVETIAKRLATKAYLQDGGYGHGDLADALLTRGCALRADGVGESTEHLFSAGVLLANMRAPWALRLAESSFATAGVECLRCLGDRDLLAAIMYGFAADMRDARAGGFETDNPMRAAAAKSWLAAVESPGKGVEIGARIFFGMSEAFRAGAFDTYVQLAGTYAGTLKRSDRFPDAAKYIVRANWALAEQVDKEQGAVSAGEVFWGGMTEDLGLASQYFRDKGEGELANIAYQLEDAAFDIASFF